MDPEREMTPDPPEEPRLSAEELWEAFHSSGEDALKDELIERHQPLVRFIAERICRTLPSSVDADDLVQEGTFGLMDAIGKFDPTRGVKFKTYCSTRIRGAILDALRSQDWVPRLVRQRASKLNTLRQTFQASYGCEPTDNEVAKALDVSEKDLPKMLKKSRPRVMHNLSDRRVSASGEPDSDIDTLGESSEVSPLDHLKGKDLMAVLTRALTPKERVILEYYYLKGLTLREIGLLMDLTESRVCQIHSNVIKRLRERLDPRIGQ
ncbi:MAG: FliA/WhiG family RNA polymerase sigma factor [Planctomycetes bacterium]|nr:FliA/WhiG family RNA polymerase sigma factor [Planctomycetota bacterium]MBL7007754.1 FliA/WhiG family RNA polymerase sigma factor [Planctomycetota bacterium]